MRKSSIENRAARSGIALFPVLRRLISFDLSQDVDTHGRFFDADVTTTVFRQSYPCLFDLSFSRRSAKLGYNLLYLR